MTDKEALFQYRIGQAYETLFDAVKMLKEEVSGKSIVNRAYYAVFYSILALFIKDDILLKTSKHSGVMSAFNKYFIHTGAIDSSYSG
ncbi:MAG: hypothetical protein HY886_03200 [Deltaproteobacteria bacterium]|nr:hypothetical protein [Deltaproteobacteria bacterium]